MALYRAQVILPFFTNLPEDVIVNQFHFEAEPTDVDIVGPQIATALDTFYTSLYGAVGTGRVSYIDWPLVYCKVFALADPPPRVPWISPSFGITAGSLASQIPTEVACVLSFQAAPESGVRYQRLYNRIYLGGIPQTAITVSAVDEFPRFSTAFTDTIKAAALALLDSGESSGAFWRQVSRATGSTIAREIVGGWVDNGPDTQRRRSVLSTLRNNWSPAA